MNACKKISRKSLRKQPATKVTLKRLKEPHGDKPKTVAVNKNPKYTEFLACKSFPSSIKCEKLLGTSKQICTPRVQLLALKKANKAYLVGLWPIHYPYQICNNYAKWYPASTTHMWRMRLRWIMMGKFYSQKTKST